jgi:hypothetical protein
MTAFACPPVVVRICTDSADYVQEANALCQNKGAIRSVPILAGGRSAAQLARVFPDHAFSETGSAQTGGFTAENLIQDLLTAVPNHGDPQRVLVVIAGRTDSLPAICYALATGRSIRLVTDFDAVAGALTGTTSAMLAGPPELFHKAFLKHLLDWSQQTPGAPRRIGIITGRDALQVFDLVAKLLIAGLQRGRTDPEPVAAEAAFEFIGAHGNEMHLSYRDGVLCGRSAGLAESPEAAFDCGVGCQFKPRYRAEQVSKRSVFLISCDGFTPSDGFAAAEFGVLFGLLDGPACNILAPYKHVQVNDALLTMIKAMARANYPLGDIAALANACFNRGLLPDYAYLVLGDPELAVAQQSGPEVPPPEHVVTPAGVLVRAIIRPGQAALSVRVPVVRIDQPLALLPVSDNLRSAAPLFAFGTTPGQDEIDVTLFDADSLPEGSIEFAVVAAQRAAPEALARASARLHKARLFDAILGAECHSADLRAQLAELLQIAGAFPRLIESVRGQAWMLHLDAVIEAQFARLQRGLADALLGALAEQRLWISQEYGKLFACVARAGPNHDAACPHCAHHVTTWRYDDPLTGLTSRHMQICDRCGIIADAPRDNPITLTVATIGTLHTRHELVKIRIANGGMEPIGVSLVVQMNRWQLDGIAAEDCRFDGKLAPGESIDHCTTLRLPSPFQDDVLAIQAFAVTDQLDLIFASQKVLAAVRPR